MKWNVLKNVTNEEKSAASFCRSMTARLLHMFCNFYFVKNHKMAKDATTIKAGEKKTSTYLESLEFQNFF